MEVRQRRLRVRRVALLAVLAAALVGFYLFMRSPYFALDHLRIRGYQRLDPATIRDWAGIDAGTLIWRVDPGAVARRLEAHPRVAGAVVRREWPRGLVIELQERTTVALLVDPAQDRWAELDAQGRILAIGRGAPQVPVADPALEDEAAPAGAGGANEGSGEARAGGATAPAGTPGADPGTVPPPVPVLVTTGPAGSGAGVRGTAGAGGLGPQAGMVWEPGRFVPEPLARAAGVAAVLAEAGLPDPPQQLVVGEGPTLVIHLASGIPVRWGLLDAAAAPKVRALAAALVAVGEEGGAVRPAYIDVTDPDRPVLGPPRRAQDGDEG